MNWTDYEAAVEQLASAQEDERNRSDKSAKQRDQTRQQLRRMSDNLASQQRAIISLADRLQVPRPALDGADRSGLGLQDATYRADNAIGRAKSLCAEAEAAAGRTRLLPDMSLPRRNRLVYGATATLISFITYCGFLIASLIVGPQVWSAHLELLPLLLPPAIAVFLGCAVINTVGRPEIRRYAITEFNLVSGSLIAFILCLVLQSLLDLLH
jgi:hypothetical protein